MSPRDVSARIDYLHADQGHKVTEEASDRARASPAQGRGRLREMTQTKALLSSSTKKFSSISLNILDTYIEY